MFFYVGTVLDAKAFDTHEMRSAGNELRDFLNNITEKYVTCESLVCTFAALWLIINSFSLRFVHFNC